MDSNISGSRIIFDKRNMMEQARDELGSDQTRTKKFQRPGHFLPTALHKSDKDKTIEYQPSSEGGTRSLPTMPAKSKMADGVWKGVYP